MSFGSGFVKSTEASWSTCDTLQPRVSSETYPRTPPVRGSSLNVAIPALLPPLRGQ